MERSVYRDSALASVSQVEKTRVFKPGFAIDTLNEEIRRGGYSGITIEGPPIRAFTDWDSGELAWNGESFQGGWLFTDQLFQGIKKAYPNRSVKHLLLIDDYVHIGETIQPRQNKAQQTDNDFLEETLLEVKNEFRRPPLLFEDITESFLESSVALENSASSCSQRDKNFQLHKDVTNPNNFHIIVHPIGYKTQQLQMLQALYSHVKDINDPSFTRQSKKNTIVRFRHVWIGKYGDILDISEPFWRDGQIQFRSLHPS